LNPDPDIAGIGVVLSFAVVAGICVILYLLCTILSMIDTTSRNPVDRWLRHTVTRLMVHRISHDKKEIWVKSLTRVLLGISDQQLITCLAILVVAIVKMVNGKLTVYHFSICTDLAWFSNSVHTMTLSVLGAHFRRRVTNRKKEPLRAQERNEGADGGARKNQIPVLILLRVVLMVICWVLLIFCLVIQGYKSWYDIFTCPVDCVRRDLAGNYGDIPGRWSTAMIVLLLLSDPLAVTNLSNRAVKARRAFRNKHMVNLDKRIRPNRSSDSKLAILYLASKAVVSYIWWGYHSVLMDVMSTLAMFAIGIWTLNSDRDTGRLIMIDQEVANEETEWGFGQLVPLFFCILPFIAAGESYWGKCALNTECPANELLLDEYYAQRCHMDDAYDDSDANDSCDDQIEMISGCGAVTGDHETIATSVASFESDRSEVSMSLGGAAQP
jgi:hypothetical protein